MDSIATPALDEKNVDHLTFPERFDLQAGRTPNRIAVVFEQEQLTYAQLQQAVNRVAFALQAKQVVAEQRVGICMDRSPEAIVAMLAVLKSHAAFVPLDPDLPRQRLSMMVEDAQIDIVLCDPKYSDRFDNGLELVDLRHWMHGDSAPEAKIPPVASKQLAYVMYTSGSTGRPKGVQIEHHALMTYCLADTAVYRLTADDRTLQFSTLNFDIAIEEIFPPLLTGGSVVVRPRSRATAQNELSTIVEAHGVTAIHLATAYWHEWVDLMRQLNQRVPRSLRLMVVTGEKVSTEHYRRWKSVCGHDVLWCNAYGPTEATVSATVFVPPIGWDGMNMPIGAPLPGYEAFILDADHQPLDEGKTGELYLSGPALARGYLHRPELTAQAFVELSIHGQLRRLYKTGDLANWLPGGQIEFGGRIDHQIKLGSYRIEPGEIEAAINRHANVCESLVTYEALDGRKHLIAYVAIGDASLTASELVDFLNAELPSYMVPTRYAFLETFPKTINGKVDRKALPSAEHSAVPHRQPPKEPRTPLERQLVDIWREVLNVPSMGIHDDFFSMGGSSLLVTRVIAQIGSQLRQEVPVRDFFAHPTVASIAAHISGLHGSPDRGVDDDVQTAIRRRLPRVTATFIPQASEQLFAVHYQPRQPVPEGRAIVICPGIGHEYQRAYRNLQQLSQQLAIAGHHVLRFDYRGTGNSTGEVHQVSDWFADIRTACRWLQHNEPTLSLCLIGIRLGATLATVAAPKDIECLVLWDAVDGCEQIRLLEQFHRESLQSFRRFNTAQRIAEACQLYGTELSHSLRESIRELTIKQRPDVPRTVEVCSQGTIPTALEHRERIHVEDAIHWHRGEQTESAFSSPHSYQAIIQAVAGVHS